eukprot:TRINITY_DN47762_c0_g1_i1.p1 TRINITY_DN47762_c0_g1~~TRINITY_DN47762_c0_g1_i1.p1  ORF type:complete len:280 (+),score=39.33 TRINITY_DN47762_c0_g1_i1:101-940(+)
MLKFHPCHTAFGVCTLFVGVEASVLVGLILEVIAISICSADQAVKIGGLKLSPTIQVICASWAFIGIPVTVSAGVGALYRIDHLVRIFFWYLLCSFPLGVLIPLWLLMNGDVCDTVVDAEVQRMGSAFVCGFTDTFVFMWTMVAGLFHLYVTYVIWSAAEDIRESNYPILSKYANKMQNVAEKPTKGSAEPYTSYGTQHPALAGQQQTKSFDPSNQGPFESLQVGPHGTQSLLMQKDAAELVNTNPEVPVTYFPSQSHMSPQSFLPMPASDLNFNSTVQ